MKAEIMAFSQPSQDLPPGGGSPIVAGTPLSVSEPIEESWFHLFALVGGLGALIATELGVAGQFALHL